MKAIGFGTLTALGLALIVTTTGCHPENMETIYGRHQPTPVVPPLPAIPPPNISDSTRGVNIPYPNDVPGHTNWNENREVLKEYSVHFLYDSSVVPSADKSKLAFVADFLKNNPNTAVRVEGNCDERGTEEYNRSLGERRALSGREELVRLGIESGRVDTLSYGEDKPLADGHHESAWKQNRRDDFIVLTPPAK